MHSRFTDLGTSFKVPEIKHSIHSIFHSKVKVKSLQSLPTFMEVDSLILSLAIVVAGYLIGRGLSAAADFGSNPFEKDMERLKERLENY